MLNLRPPKTLSDYMLWDAMSITEADRKPLFPARSKVKIHKTQIDYNEIILHFRSQMAKPNIK